MFVGDVLLLLDLEGLAGGGVSQGAVVDHDVRLLVLLVDRGLLLVLLGQLARPNDVL